MYKFLKRSDFFNWFRYRMWERNHVVKLRYLQPGYHDADERLIHSMFEVLCQFMENERPGEIVAWDSDPEHKHAWSEMNTLYKWWKKRQNRSKEDPILQPNIKSPDMKFTPTGKKWLNPQTKKEESTSRMDFVHKSTKDKKNWEKACNDSAKWEKKCYDEDGEMMIRLVKIRGYMWT
jgi:hypothetical protein